MKANVLKEAAATVLAGTVRRCTAVHLITSSLRKEVNEAVCWSERKTDGARWKLSFRLMSRKLQSPWKDIGTVLPDLAWNLLFLNPYASGSVTGNTIDAMMEDSHSLWDFAELYIQLDLTCKDIKSVIGNRRGLNVSKRHHKTLLSVRGLSCCRGTLILLSWFCKIAFFSFFFTCNFCVSIPSPTAAPPTPKLLKQCFKMQFATPLWKINKVKDKADDFVVCAYIVKYFESVKDHGIFYQFLS